MTPLDEIEALLAGTAMADPRAFRKLYAGTAPAFWVALHRAGIAEPEERLEEGFARIWQEAAAPRDDIDATLWMAQRLGFAADRDALVLAALDSLPPKPPPPQVLNRLEGRLWGRRRLPLWRQVVPYVVGAVIAALLAWVGMMTGVVEPI